MWDAIIGGVASLLLMWLWAWSFSKFWTIHTRLNSVENQLNIHEDDLNNQPLKSSQMTLDEF